MPDHDSPETIIEAVREWQEAYTASAKENAEASGYSARMWAATTTQRLRALRLPPKGEGR